MVEGSAAEFTSYPPVDATETSSRCRALGSVAGPRISPPGGCSDPTPCANAPGSDAAIITRTATTTRRIEREFTGG